ncbi:indolepyruvate oxidoreductase subunit beta family protein [Lichenifustis flavocetrariae]|uniref:Indolepyruvate oxidoreductase subunit beta family protein n=1 Tax=Lichenifustis flavocetrariae TaxID=2949735 RepID=A0AA41Z652_9HYPH|nr:indolepyruvate oxidoreductase subunit beta family protein [Lichenifustis flavocetrariae]MCW6509987.1 indolepyruvate oxidoreductase subunit beta family protein [Lichenifustis flavocetrariae]
MTAPLRLSTDRPICVAILAMGGQGGGVLSDWIVALAEAEGWAAQSTSVPGVAQRTGATIYYIEMLPERDGKRPIFALMPTPGDVDVVLAAEWMEAGRSILRGLVTPDRTTVIASTHRAFAVQEKERPGNGIADSGAVIEAGDVAAKQIVSFDMQTMAERNGTVISATLFGALAGTGVLPFRRDAYEAAIRAGGKGAAPSLRGFAAAFERAQAKPSDTSHVEPVPKASLTPERTGHPDLDALLERIGRELPEQAQGFARAGIERLVGYQDAAYAADYLDRLQPLLALDRQHDGEAKHFALTTQAAKYLAVALAYDDVIRVADLKTRASRFDRVRREVAAKADQIVYTTEYMHPRMEEVLGTLPRRWAEAIEARPALVRALDRVVNRGRRVRTGTILWFLSLYILSGLKRFRSSSLRHARETGHIAHWLDVTTTTAPRDYDLAVEALACRRLVKGYSDTHARGLSKFDLVLAEVPFLTGRPESAAWLRRLKEAALADEKGVALEGAVRTMHSAYP